MFRILAVVFCILSLFVGGAYWYLSQELSPKDLLQKSGLISADPQKDFDLAEKWLEKGEWDKSLRIIRAYNNLPKEERGKGIEWQDLELQVLYQSKNFPGLVQFYRTHPKILDKHEEISFLLAQVFVQFRQFNDYDKLWARWKNREKTLERDWFLVDVDSLLFRQRFDEAYKVLTSRKFDNKDDIPRLIRLAMLLSQQDVEKAWSVMEEAYQLDPSDSRVRTLRGNILEAVGKVRLARVEYMAAFMSDSQDPAARDQLGEFYRRHRDYVLAIATWGGGLEQEGTDFLWSKTWFWNRVVQSLEFDWASKESPQGRLKPFVDYLKQLPQGQFWNESQFAQLPESPLYSRSRQEVYWLRLMDDLKNGREQDALQRLESNQFVAQSWYPRLEETLKQVLYYRKDGTLPLPSPSVSQLNNEGEIKNQLSVPDVIVQDNPFFLQIDAMAALSREERKEQMAVELDALLKSDEVFSLVMIAAGWREAGIQLLNTEVLSESHPGWSTYMIGQALQINRGSAEALLFVAKQHKEPIVRLLEGELLIQTGNVDAGVAQLNLLLNDSSAVGFRAALILGNLYTEQKNFEKARSAWEANERLQEHPMGTELLARINYLEGDVEKADELFRSIQEQSFLAKSYLAKRAFDSENYEQAKVLTLQLLKERPDMLQLRANLKLIEDVKSGKKSSESFQTIGEEK